MSKPKFRQYNYKGARENWEPSVADSIWHKLLKPETRGRATIVEDKALVEKPRAKDVQSIVDNIIRRSFGAQK